MLVLEKLVIAEQVLLREVRSAVILRRRVSMASRTRTISAASPLALAPATDQTDHNALNDQFLGGDQIGIQRVLGL